MDWAGAVKIMGIVAALAFLFLALRFLYQAGKRKGREEGVTDTTRRGDEATERLADKLYTGVDPFGVLHKDGWDEGIATGPSTGVGVESDRTKTNRRTTKGRKVSG